MQCDRSSGVGPSWQRCPRPQSLAGVVKVPGNSRAVSATCTATRLPSTWLSSFGPVRLQTTTRSGCLETKRAQRSHRLLFKRLPCVVLSCRRPSSTPHPLPSCWSSPFRTVHHALHCPVSVGSGSRGFRLARAHPPRPTRCPCRRRGAHSQVLAGKRDLRSAGHSGWKHHCSSGWSEDDAHHGGKRHPGEEFASASCFEV